MHPPSGPGAEILHQARSLLDDLPVVIDHLIIPDSSGGIEEIHARCTDDLTAADALRIIRGALAAHLHVDIPEEIFRVVSGGVKGDGFPGISVRRPSGPPPRIVGGVDTRRAGDRRVAVHPDGVAGRGDSGTPVAPAGTSRSSREVESADSVGGAGRSRIQFAGVEQAHDRSRRTRIRVRLEWDGRSYQGTETGPDVREAKEAILARATLRAVEAVFEGAGPVGTSLTLEGVERVAAFGKEYLVVGVIVVTEDKMKPLAGVVPVVDGEERAVVLATLHAVNECVSEFLGRDTDPPSPASTLDPDSGDPFEVWG